MMGATAQKRGGRGHPEAAVPRVDDRDVFGQRGVERLGNRCDRRTAGNVETRDLTRRVDSSVGAPGHGEAAPAAATTSSASRRTLPTVAPRAASPTRRTRCRRTRASAERSPRPSSTAVSLRGLDLEHEASIPVTTTSCRAGPRGRQCLPRLAVELHLTTGRQCGTTTARRPTSVSTPTAARRCFDHQTKNAVSATSITAAVITAIHPRAGDGDREDDRDDREHEGSVGDTDAFPPQWPPSGAGPTEVGHRSEGGVRPTRTPSLRWSIGRYAAGSKSTTPSAIEAASPWRGPSFTTRV